MLDLIPEELREEFAAMQVEAQEASFGEFSSCELRSAICDALRAKRESEDGSRYAHAVDYFRTFFITREEDVIDGRWVEGYYKRPYTMDGLSVTVGDRGMRVEQAWVELLRPSVDTEPATDDDEDSMYEAVERGVPCQEALAAQGDRVNAQEVTDSFREAEFSTGVIEGIVPIRPGISKNNRYYSEAVLKRDYEVFNGIAVFYDHQDQNQPKPLKNVIGVLENARWDDELKAPRADMKFPPSMESVVEEIKQKHTMLGPDRVGFSIDMPITVTAKKVDGKTVRSVEALLGGDNASTDIVFRPAAGGSFDQAFEAQGNEDMALEGLTLEEIKAARPDLFPAVEAVAEAAPVAAPVAAPAVEMSQETIDEKISKAAARMFNQSAFEARVRDAKVPQRIKDVMLREGKALDFEPSACESVITDWLNTATAAQGGPSIVVPGGVNRVTESEDVRFARLLGAGMGYDQEVNGQTVRRFTSLREALGAFDHNFKMLAVDAPQRFAREAINQMHWGGGELSEYVQGREAITSSTFSNAWADVMNKVLLKEMADPELNTWKALVSDYVPFSDLTRSHKFIRVGDYPDIAAVSEGAPYQYMTGATEEKVEFGISKYGNLEKYTWESALADDLGVLGRIPRKLGQAWAWTVYRFIYALFTTGSGVGATMDYDSKALYHNDHNNIASDAFTAAKLVEAEGKFRQQCDISQTSNFKMYRGKYLLYANETSLRQAIWEALVSSFKINPLSTSGSQVNLPNYIREYFGLEPIEVMYSGTTTRWELVADPRRVSTIAVGFLQGMETPEIFVQDMERVGSVFNSDQITYKIRGTIGADVLDHRSFVRGNV